MLLTNNFIFQSKKNLLLLKSLITRYEVIITKLYNGKDLEEELKNLYEYKEKYLGLLKIFDSQMIKHNDRNNTAEE